MKYPARYLIPVLLVVLATSSCDCEERIRKMISNPGDRKQQVEEAKKRRTLTESSAPKEEEPNDFPKQATLFELGGDLRPVEAEIGADDDKDWFALTSRNDEEWQVQATVTPTSDELDVVIRVALSDSEDAPMTYDVAGAGEPETIPILSVSSMPQRIVVEGKGGTTGSYEISFQKRLSGGSVEAEPNDDIDAASRFEAPGEVQGFYDRPQDRDVYFVPRKGLTGDVFTLEVSPIDDFVQQVRVYTNRSLETPYLSLQVPPTKSAGVPNLALPDDVLGVWVVLTAGESFSREKSYRLKLLGHPPAEHGIEAEPNDSAETAHKIGPETKLVGYFHAVEDVDHYRLFVDGVPDEAAEQGADAGGQPAAGAESPDAPDAGAAEAADAGTQAADAADGQSAQMPADPLEKVADKEPASHIVRVTAVPKHEKARVALAWTPEGGQGEVSVIKSDEAGQPAVLCNRVVEEDYLDFEVRRLKAPESMLEGAYDYGLVVEDVRGEPGLEIEPNQTRDQADKLEPSRDRVGYIARTGDVDVYAFAVPYPEPKSAPLGTQDASAPAAPPAPKPRTVQLVLGANSLNLGFKLFDDEGGLIAHVNRAGAGGEERLQVDLPPGLYFAYVSAKRGSACEPYKMSVRVKD